jgi:hypothetical protein
MNLFNGNKIRAFDDADLAELNGLPEATYAAAIACIEAVNARDAVFEKHVAARSDVHDKQRLLAAAILAYEQPLPAPLDPLTRQPITGATGQPIGPQAGARTNHALKQAAHAAAMQAVIAAQKPGYKSPKPVKSKLKDAADVARDAKDAADVALEDAQAMFRAVTKELVAAETLAGEKIEAYRQTLPVMSHDTLMKEHFAAGLAERQRRVDAGLPPDVPKVEPQYQSVYDRERAAAGEKRKVRPLMTGHR